MLNNDVVNDTSEEYRRQTANQKHHLPKEARSSDKVERSDKRFYVSVSLEAAEFKRLPTLTTRGQPSAAE